ncbi:hypothetical protein P168DRAFT_307995 [Aspergillus campestris IBT 28561]|uniref:Alpha/beta-hydrolase n=1 Tax=Aspergillus campestris (strain IBT 28561) TaxID=1392248 RepID=A0A2I1DCU9_ASPC2|nr:uncharacterized protein P168DRAFT_307995 [Aspergillus campestris IBT 28561]PKY07708.1 hypothetical protein P168DRAFT_307995 [Aspergillus campestris IBT 28561]
MTDPLKTLDQASAVSRKTYPIAGILTTVFGLDELPPQASEVACLWLLHPRLGTQERMVGIATAIINDWNQRIRDGRAGPKGPAKGLIAVSFDQRNHGSRLVDPLGNESWKKGNPRHAQDMFSMFQGTAKDVSVLIDYLPSYVFPKTERTVPENLVLGVSLGGHAAWSCLFHEPRISTGVVIIGCPDYVNLMADRARLSKLPEWTTSDPPGSQFLGSEAFPSTLLSTVRKLDPASLLLGVMGKKNKTRPLRKKPIAEPSGEEQKALRPLLKRTIAGKNILTLSGGVDKLVPYHRGEIFLNWLKQAIGSTGWFADGAITFEDIIDESAAHEVTPKMVAEAVRFVGDVLAGGEDSKSGIVRESKI